MIPTLCDFAGIEVPTELAGHSVKPLTQSSGRPKEWRKDVVVENEGSRVLVSERHKYAVYDHGEPREMLVDLTSDPGEMHNLAVDSKYASLLAGHRNRLRAWYDSKRMAARSERLAGDRTREKSRRRHPNPCKKRL